MHICVGVGRCLSPYSGVKLQDGEVDGVKGSQGSAGKSKYQEKALWSI